MPPHKGGVLAVVMCLIFSTLGIAPEPTPRIKAAPEIAKSRIFLPVAGQTQAGEIFTELVEGRGASDRVFVGTTEQGPVLRFQHYTEPVYFQNPETKQWHLIDNRIISDAKTGSYHNAAASFSTEFANPSNTVSAVSEGSFPLLKLSRPGQPVFTFHVPGTISSTPSITDDTITYANIAPSTDLVYQIHSWGIKEEVVLHDASASPIFTLLLDAPGVELEAQSDGSWLAIDSNDNQLWRILAPHGTDARNVIAPLKLDIAKELNSRYRLVLSVDTDWLKAPNRAFPVRLDPSLADPQYVYFESYVQSSSPDLASWNQRNRFIGRSTYVGNKGVTRLFTPVDLSFLPAGIKADQVGLVELVFTQYVSEASGGFTTSVYPLTSPWDDESLTWNNQPGIGPATAQNVPISSALGAKRWDITNWTKQVIQGTTPNYGLSIRADDETRGGGIFWASGCTSTCPDPLNSRPYIQVQVSLDSGLNPVLDTWRFANREGIPNFEQFVEEYGRPATTHLITETRQLDVITATTTLTLPISLKATGLAASLPLTPTADLVPPDNVTNKDARYIPRPIGHLYEEVIVKAIYDDQFTEAYNAAIKGGLCAGMAATVADFHSTDSGRPLPVMYGGTDTVRSIPDNPEAEELIQKYHGRQVSSQVLNWLAESGRYDAIGLYNHLVSHIASDWWNNPEVLGIIKGSNCDDIEIGHALLPYKVVPQSGNRAHIYVYDPNYPPSSTDDAANRYIEIDLIANTWTYELAPATDTRPAIRWTGRALYSTPLNLFRERPILPTQSGTDVMMVDGGTRFAWGGTRFAWGGTRFAWGEHDGTHTGCYVDDGGPEFVQEIERTLRVTPLTTGLNRNQAFPDTLFFPAGKNWSFTGVGSLPGQTSDMLFFGPQSVAGFMSTANDTTRDTANIDASFLSLNLQTADASKPMSLYQMHETNDWTRVYAVSNTTLGASEDLTLTVHPSLSRFEVVNRAAIDKTMDVGFSHIGNDGISTIVYPEQPIGAQERRIYTPIDWTDLTHSPIKVEIDFNADGSIDRVELLGGDVFPAATSIESVPDQSGQLFPILTHTKTAPGHFGWINLDYPLAPGLTPDESMQTGNASVLRKWLASGGNPGIVPGGGVVGVSGTHGNVFTAIGTPIPGEEVLYRVGDLMVVPVYDQVITSPGSQPIYYRVAGFAVVRITESTNHGPEDDACTNNPACKKRVMGELIAKIIH